MNRNLIGRIIKYLRFYIDREALIWASALIFLLIYCPARNGFTLCPLHNLGISFCPGCGLGRSVSLFLHGDIAGSFHMHYLGPFVTLLLIYRITTLSIRKIKLKKIKTEDSQWQTF